MCPFEHIGIVETILLTIGLLPFLVWSTAVIIIGCISVLFGLVDLIFHLMKGEKYEVPHQVVCLRLWQVPRSPDADRLYEGIYDAFVEC